MGGDSKLICTSTINKWWRLIKAHIITKSLSYFRILLKRFSSSSTSSSSQSEESKSLSEGLMSLPDISVAVERSIISTVSSVSPLSFALSASILSPARIIFFWSSLSCGFGFLLIWIWISFNSIIDLGKHFFTTVRVSNAMGDFWMLNSQYFKNMDNDEVRWHKMNCHGFGP